MPFFETFCAALLDYSPSDAVIQNATVMTETHGTIEHGSAWLHQGKIAGVGAFVNAAAAAAQIDGTGKYVTPGIIDPHSHSALDSDVNEATSPVTPSMMMIDAFDNRDKALYQVLAGGVTTELLLHGSANMIGGQAVVIKNKFGLSRDEMCSHMRRALDVRTSVKQVFIDGVAIPMVSRQTQLRDEYMSLTEEHH